MGTIIERPRADGSIGYLAQIAMMRNGKSFRQSQTFDRKAAAEAWIKKRESELSKPNGFEIALQKRKDPTLGAVIDQYIHESSGGIGRSKLYALKAIKATDLADKKCSEINSREILSYASDLRKTRQPSTVSGYLSHLSSIFSIARAAWGYELNERDMDDAFKVAKRLGHTGKSRRRDRRPSLEELNKLMSFFVQSKRGPDAIIPMQAIVMFALFSTRRQEEITKLRWDQLDEQGSKIFVRDMKHPGEKDGNDVWCVLPEPALTIVNLMPRVAAEIFPYNHRSISSSFTRACKVLSISDLRFHDLRHEGISRLFEMGTDIPRVAEVSGHRTWESLRRYTHLRQTGDKYAGWKWLEPGRILPVNAASEELKRIAAKKGPRQLKS